VLKKCLEARWNIWDSILWPSDTHLMHQMRDVPTKTSTISHSRCRCSLPSPDCNPNAGASLTINDLPRQLREPTPCSASQPQTARSPKLLQGTELLVLNALGRASPTMPWCLMSTRCFSPTFPTMCSTYMARSLNRESGCARHVRFKPPAFSSWLTTMSLRCGCSGARHQKSPPAWSCTIQSCPN
jgi:hypothetical protein